MFDRREMAEIMAENETGVRTEGAMHARVEPDMRVMVIGPRFRG
jgi:hypothetical protein